MKFLTETKILRGALMQAFQREGSYSYGNRIRDYV